MQKMWGVGFTICNVSGKVILWINWTMPFMLYEKAIIIVIPEIEPLTRTKGAYHDIETAREF